MSCNPFGQGDKAWPAMQIDMASHLMDEVRRGIPADSAEWRQELKALHDSAKGIERMLMSIDSAMAARHSDTIKYFEEIQATLDRMEDKIDILLARTAPQATSEGIVAPVPDAELAASIREMIQGGNPLEKAAAEVAAASSHFRTIGARVAPDDWHPIEQTKPIRRACPGCVGSLCNLN